MGAVDTIEWAWVLCGCHIQNELVEQQICIRFCVKLENSSVETIWMLQKATAMGNWWWAASSQQYIHLRITSPAEFFCKTSNHSGDSPPLQPRFGTLWLLAFPKTKITFKREAISVHSWDSGKYYVATDVNWESCVRSQGAYTEGDWGIIVLCTMFLVLCMFLKKGLYFSYNMAGYLLDRPHISKIQCFFNQLKQTFSALYKYTGSGKSKACLSLVGRVIKRV